MTDEQPTPTTPPAAPHTAPSPPREVAAAPAAPEPGERTDRVSLRDRAFGLRAVIGVALASLLLGGVGGVAFGSVTGDGHDGRGGPGDRGGFGGPPQSGFPQGSPGGVAPGRPQPPTR